MLERLGILRAFGLLIASRSKPIFSWIWATAVCCLVAARGFPSPLTMALVLLSAAGRAICGYAYNDITDVEMDRFNSVKRNRPLPSGKASIKEALRLVFLSGSAAIALSLLINLNTFLLTIIWIALFAAYSNPHIRLKKMFLLKESSIAINFIVTSLIAGTAVGSVTSSVIFSGMFLFGFTLMAVPAIADSSDIEEDKKFGMKTLGMVLSWKTKIEMIMAFVLVIMTLTPLTYVQLGFNLLLPIMVVAAGLVVLRLLFPLTRHIEDIAYESGQNRSFNAANIFFMTVTVAMVIGSITI